MIWLRRAPFQVGELAHIGEEHLGGKDVLAASAHPQNAGEDRQVGGGDRVPSRLEQIQRFAVAVEDGALALAHDDLAAEAEIARTDLR